MAILYSQNSRKLLLYDNIYKKQKNTNKLYNIINKILLNHYISQEKAMKYYNVLKPENIISSYLPDITNMNKKFMLKKGWFFYMYLPKFLTVLGKSCMTLDRYKGEHYINLLKIFDFYKTKLTGHGVQIKLLPNYQQLLLEQKTNPDYLIVNRLTNNDTETDNALDAMIRTVDVESIIGNNKINLNNMKLKNNGKRFKGLDNLEKVIEFNGDTYVLDSCLLTNYNKTVRGNNHAICGISCKNNKYVYNGWMRTTYDPSIVDKSLFKHDNMPCELMKFDWDVNNPRNKFCLNHRLCQLPMIDKTVKYDLCFSFGKGVRSVIYVKTNKNFKSLDDDSKSLPEKQVSLKKTVKKADKKKKECPEGKVLNHLTGRCINIKTIKKDDKNTVKKTVNKNKECPEGKVLNPLTGRCINIKTIKKDDKKTVKKTDKKKKECPEGKVLNPLTGRCINIKTIKKDDKKTDKKNKECPEGKVLNPLTGRCINIKK
jgi:hypothetical protein